MVIELYELGDLCFQVSGQKIILQVHNVLHGAVVAFDLALSLRMQWHSVYYLDLLLFQKAVKLTGDIAAAVVT